MGNPPHGDAEQRWAARPWLARLLQVALFSAPLLASLAAVHLVAALLPAALGGPARIALLALTGLAVAVLLERLGRRFLPLAALLRLTMLFPDQAPSRFRVARAAGDPEALTRRLARQGDVSARTAAEQVLTLLTALTAHDRRTRGHSERVRVFGDLLASELRLDQADTDRLRWAALLHDVGKLRVAERILNKPGPLTGDEFAVIRLHPERGAELAAPLLSWLGEWGRGILEHHEKYDGSGYPAGLERQAISPAGRLISVIDAYETMTAPRAYKKAMPVRAAREELARCAGTHFDPVYVRAFLAVSLPRLLWAMGPLSLLVQLPFLRTLADAGARSGSLPAQAASHLSSAGAVATAGATSIVLAASLPMPPPVAVERPPAVATAASQSAVAPAAPTPADLPAAPEPATVPEAEPALVPPPAAAPPAPVEPEPAAPAAPAPPPAPAAPPAPRYGTGTPLTPGTPLGAGVPIGALLPAPPPLPVGDPVPVPVAEPVPLAGPTLTEGPHGRIKEPTVTFRFEGEAPDGFECSLDAGTWTPCESGVTYSDLTEEWHLFAVRAVGTEAVTLRQFLVKLEETGSA